MILAFALATLVAQKPNVIVILCDDMGYGDLSSYGEKSYRTPNIDKLAQQGVRFTDFYSASPGCSPSRAALLTACYPQRVGIPAVLMPWSRESLSPSEETMAEVFKAQGYATSIIGKWHLGHSDTTSPLNHGFDSFYGLPYSNDMWPPNSSQYQPLPLLRNRITVRQIDSLEDQAELTTLYTDEAIRVIRQNKNHSFFLYLAHSMPHVPIGAQKKFRGKAPTPYGDTVLDLDDSTGRIVRELDRLGLRKNTIVIFTSDNGPWSPYGDHAGHTGGLRGHKGTTFEGGMRVPCIVSWPGRIPAYTSSAMATNIDLLPTLAELAGVAWTPKNITDGISLAKELVSKEPSPRLELFYYYPGQLRAIRVGEWKLHVPHKDLVLSGPPGTKGGRVGESSVPIGLSLYHLPSDPAEVNNLVNKHPQIVEKLLLKIRKMRYRLGDTLTKATGSEIRPAAIVEPK